MRWIHTMAKKKMKFKVVSGSHTSRAKRDKNGKVVQPSKVYNANDPKNSVVESDVDLMKIFPNKFVRVGNHEVDEQEEQMRRSRPAGQGGEENADRKPPTAKSSTDEDEMEKAVKGDLDPKQVKEKARKANLKAKEEEDEEDEEDEEEEVDDDSDEEEEEEYDLGEDVTEDFTADAKKDYLVFKSGREYFVAEAGEPNDPLNPKGLKKKDVVPFLKKQRK
jgi:hypothetical protein